MDHWLRKFDPSGKSFLYAVAGRHEVTIYSESWQDGNVIAFKLHSLFPFVNGGNACDFSRDLSTIACDHRVGHGDRYLLSQW